MTEVVLGLGSNRQLEAGGIKIPPVEILRTACEKLDYLLEEAVFSSVYITKPMYVTDQCDFYNMVVKGYYKGTPENLLRETQMIEAELGRDRSREIRNGPRSLDIDIEKFGSESINTPELTVPHPRLHERAFVLVPLLEILNDSADKTDKERFRKYLECLPDQGVRYYGRLYGEGR